MQQASEAVDGAEVRYSGGRIMQQSPQPGQFLDGAYP